MDLVWSIIGSKLGDEQPTEKELESLNNPELANKIKIAFQKGHWTPEMREIFDSYWEIHGKREINKFVKKEKQYKFPRSVIIGDTYFTRYGEPLKRGDKVKWVSLFGEWSGILKDFKMKFSSIGYEVKVICFIQDGDVLQELNDGDAFNVDGENHEKYFNLFLENPLRS